MARSPEAQAEQAEILRRLERGISELASSARWQEYLATAAKFHNYRTGSNIMLITLQRPDATRVAGFKTWQSLGRQVRKGEKGIAILAPCSVKVKDEERAEHEAKLEAEGWQTFSRRIFFRTVYVFDVSQTDGAELELSPVHLLDGNGAGELLASLEVIAGELGFAVVRTNADDLGSANGDTSFELRRIRLAADRSIDQQAKTLAHELGHVLCQHDKVNYSAERARCELEAESVAFVVCSAQGLVTDDYSFGYVAHWSDAKAIKASAETILGASGDILERLVAKVSDPLFEQAAA